MSVESKILDSEDRISVALSAATDSLWRDCYALQNEMILTCAGRRIFPTLEFTVSGLDPSKFYSFGLHLALVDNMKLRFSNGKWIETSSTEPETTPRKVWHLNGTALGSQWMSRPFTFDQVRITNRKSKEEGNSSYIYLHTQHRYIPVITVYECTSDFMIAPKLIKTVKIAHSEFITVTAYHKEEINTFKTNNNPYSTGSRKDRRRERNTSPPTSEDSYSESSTSPPPLKKAKLEVSSSPSPMDPLNGFSMPNFTMVQSMYFTMLSQLVASGQMQLPFGAPFFPNMPLTPPIESPEFPELAVEVKKEPEAEPEVVVDVENVA